MIYTGGKSIVSAYTNGISVKEIYANGVKVWPTTPISGSYYLRYSPSEITGKIYLGSYYLYSYDFADYSGEIQWNGIGSIAGYDGNWSYNIYTTLTSVETNAETIGIDTFEYCSALTTIYLPDCKIIESGAFRSCTSLQNISLPNCKVVGVSAFNSCPHIISIYLPECEQISGYAFAGRSGSPANRDIIDLPKCGYIGNCAFDYGWMNYLYLKNESVVSVVGNIFGSNGGAYRIYVPSSLVSDYQNDTYWSSYSNKIYPIE